MESFDHFRLSCVSCFAQVGVLLGFSPDQTGAILPSILIAINAEARNSASHAFQHARKGLAGNAEQKCTWIVDSGDEFDARQSIARAEIRE